MVHTLGEGTASLCLPDSVSQRDIIEYIFFCWLFFCLLKKLWRMYIGFVVFVHCMLSRVLIIGELMHFFMCEFGYDRRRHGQLFACCHDRHDPCTESLKWYALYVRLKFRIMC